jgi:hypothetical protein
LLLPGVLLCALAVAPALADNKPKTSVADLRYGVSLFHYYQQDHLSALTELMIADTRDGIKGHGDHPELITGGISLAFGMNEHAERLFHHLLQDSQRPQSVRDAAWFYLGKLHYTRANWADAEQSFARVSAEFSPRLTAEMNALRVNLQIRREQLVAIPLKQLDEKQLRDWSAYALYNMGAAYARNGNYKQARNYYRALTKAEVPEGSMARREYLALLDKTYTALGYSYLLEKSYSAAISEFTRVRLDSPQAHRALLGYGWAALEQEQYAEAIKPWQVLQQRSLVYPEVQEALLALPFAYEKLGAPGEALAAYETAEQLLLAEIQRLQDMRATLTQGELLTLIGSPPQSDAVLRESLDDATILTAVVTNDGANWLKLDKTSIIKTRSAYLSELFAQNEFQADVLDLRDLLRLRLLLQEWQPKLEIYTDLLHEKQALRLQKEQQMAQQALREQQSRMAADYAQLAAQLAQINENNDYMALADNNSRDLYRMVERAQSNLDLLRVAGENTEEEQARVTLYRGILLWEAAQEFPDRRWQLEKNRLISERTLGELAATYDRIDQLSATHIDIQPLLARIAQMQRDTRSHLAQTDAMIETRSAALRAQVDDQLNRQQKRLNAYLAQAHLAVARLYDTALREQAP